MTDHIRNIRLRFSGCWLFFTKKDQVSKLADNFNLTQSRYYAECDLDAVQHPQFRSSQGQC